MLSHQMKESPVSPDGSGCLRNFNTSPVPPPMSPEAHALNLELRVKHKNQLG